MVRLCLSLVAGLLSVAALAEDFTVHTWEKLTLNELFYSEGAYVGDFNKDGTLDVVAGPFWYQGPDFKTKHEYYPPLDGKENKAVDKDTLLDEPAGQDGPRGHARKCSRPSTTNRRSSKTSPATASRR